MSTYFDSSFLVSLYVADANSARAASQMPLRSDLWITTFTELEVVNALNLCVFRKEISSLDGQSSLQSFDRDLRSQIFLLKPLPENAFMRAKELSRQTTPRMGTRASDILHVAAALELGADTFYTFDRQQAKLAQTMKLKTNLLQS